VVLVGFWMGCVLGSVWFKLSQKRFFGKIKIGFIGFRGAQLFCWVLSRL
jgi:hypothetical protein